MYSNRAILIYGIIKSGIKLKSCAKIPLKVNRTKVCCEAIYNKLSYTSFATDFPNKVKPQNNETEVNEEITLVPLPPEMEELANGDLETGKKIRMILMEHEMEKLTNNRVPSVLTPEAMKSLLEIKGFMGRKRHFNYLFLKEIQPLIDEQKKERRKEKRLERLKMKQEVEGDHISYGLGRNSIFPYIREQSISQFYQLRQSYSLMYGQPLIYDLGYEHEMTKRELQNMIDQLQLAYALNKVDKEPFNLHFVNANFNSWVYEKLKLAMPQLQEDDNMVTITDKSYTELFPKNNLVYLSPNAKNSLKTFNPDSIYIIGAIVDLGSEIPLTMSKAKREGIATARLPFDEHLLWGTSARKCLTLNQLMKIMLEVKISKDWKQALLSGVPRRKLKSIDDIREVEFQKQKAFIVKNKQIQKRDGKIMKKTFWKELM